ncbi:unnamed protein product [Cylindrotheca closterium]|uniref:Uncharacterized protein n=1 Tax=Cylindrotheca closterium TaxID=2856 RepID=A0AAD2G920_9STRA|nr:unnamed protein product [Cylindrotheca closterium]
MLNLQVYRNPEGDRLCAVVGSEAKSAIETAGWKAAPISFASTAAQVQSLIGGNTVGIGQQVAVENPGLDNELQMALMKLYSTEEERRETISNLIKRGANMGMSMIRVAADTQNGAKTLEILMELGGSVQQSDQYGSTPLHIAAVFCNADVAEILLKNGADIEAKDKDGETPMMVLEKTIDRSQEMELGFGSVMPPDERQRQDKIKQLFDAAVASPAKS